jgi:integrase
MGCVRLRVKDIDFDQHQIIVRNGKRRKDRDTLVAPLQRQLRLAKRQHQNDLAVAQGQVYPPFALARKYPNAAREWGWQYVFPSPRVI